MRYIILCAMQVLLLAGLSGVAQAGQSGSFVCAQHHIAYYNGRQVSVCDAYELRVHITTDGDAGLPGAFGIGLQLPSGGVAYWTAANGWQESVSGDSMPVDGYYDALPPARDYVVYHGTLAGMCVYGAGFKVAAGYGALQPDRAAQIDSLIAHPNVKVSVDHLRSTFIRMDGMKGNKWGVVYDGRDCAPLLSHGGS